MSASKGVRPASQFYDPPVKPKPTVHYHSREELAPFRVGVSAWVWPVDHTSPLVSNTKLVKTSNVVSIDPNGVDFETLNTKYVFLRREEA